ncbi:sulfatase-like hydrolase/transferase [Paenibacillus validus]|uniref:sulfatase family protein n=1 Tax=Paenibacillus validus TaxID=44253 RepID=UPI000FDCBA70|nr:sulfatase-like hydrolase/transferase [Paenibacillus validus]MED4602287.1 sulfatase-like hydrolase/transferase [Paenibacillus validus]MED4608159.1 sulfatase-like hydrolase/transferase [Paenibacillus validus]
MNRPNFLFLFPDTHRGDWMPYASHVLSDLGMNELPLRMPNLEALMKQGVTFTRAVTPSPLCAPARACLASGLRYNKADVAGNHEDYSLSRKTIYSVLKDNGYRVGGVGKFDLHKATQWWGLDGWIDDLGKLGFTDAIDNAGKIDAVHSGKQSPRDPYMKYLYDQGLAEIHLQDMTERGQRTNATDLPDEAYCDNWLTRNGIQMLKQFPRDQPWFLMVNFVGPHEPWDITHRMKAAWENVQFAKPNRCSLPEKTWNSIRQNYAAMLENIDRNVGLLLEEVKRRGELENTVILYSSDHGDLLGDFDKFGKCKPERGSVHIPLVISGPNIQKGKYSDALVELQDLASTILDFADLTMVEAEDSLSLKPHLLGESETVREVQISGLDEGPQHPSKWRMVSNGEWKLIVEQAQHDRLYFLKDDPWENRNVAEDYPDIAAHLKAVLGMA